MTIRLAILADIHGNMPALEAVVADMQPFQPDHVIVAGDSINIAPFSEEVLDYIQRVGWSVVRGNHEYYLLDYDTPRAKPHWTGNPSSYTFLPGLQQRLHMRWAKAISLWPDTLAFRLGNAPSLRVAHGTGRDPFEAIQPDTEEATLEQMFPSMPETTIITAHTHRPLDITIGKRRVLNPGSVGWSLDGNRAASYLLLDETPMGWQATLRRVSYDITAIFQRWDTERAFHDWGAFGLLMRDEFLLAQDLTAFFLAWHRQHHAGELFLMEHAEAFLADYKQSQTLPMAQQVRES